MWYNLRMPKQETTTAISPELSAKLTVVSFISACFVVVLHAYDKSFAAGGGLPAWAVVFIGRIMPTFAVPVFFVISGYLLGVKSCGGSREGWYAQALGKRAKTLLVPYLLWCTVYALTVVPFTMYGNHAAGRALLHNTHLHAAPGSLWNIVYVYGGDLFHLPVASVMWYVRNLMMLVLIAPPLIRLLRSRLAGAAFLCASFGALLMHDWIPGRWWNLFETGFSLAGVFYFSVGLFLSIHAADYPLRRQRNPLWPVLWLGGCALFTYIHFLHPTGGGLLAVQRMLAKVVTAIGVLAVWTLYDLVPGASRFLRLSVVKDSFFVYAAHLGIISTVTCARTQDILATRLHVPAFGLFVIRIAVPILLALAAAEILKRWLPKAYALLTGGR